MEKKVNLLIVDSNMFIGYANEHDVNHIDSIKAVNFALKNTKLMIITPFIFSEIVTVLSQKAGRKIAIKVGNYLQKSIQNGLIDNFSSNEIYELEIWKLFCDTISKNISYVDCSIAVTAQKLNATVLSFDKHLKQLGRKFGFKVIGA